MSKNNNKNDKYNKIFIFMLAVIFTLLVSLITAYYIQNNAKDKDNENIIGYTDLIKKIDNKEIQKIKMTVGSTTVKVKDIYMTDEDKEKTSIVPNTQAFIELIQEKVQEGNEIELIQNQVNPVVKTMAGLSAWIPTLLLIAMFGLLINMNGLGDKGKVYNPESSETKIKFEDVAGLDEEKEELIEIVNFLKEPKKFNEMGAKVPKGVLLCGKPGTGKTLIAKAIAGEASVPFISMSGSEFIEMFAGLGASRVRKLFEKARKVAPCIIFIDEIDAIGARRTTSSGAESENNQTLNQLLVEMDGFNSEETIIVLAATNRPEMLDKALLRPGRFDRQVHIALPDLKGREEILKIHSKGKKFVGDVNLKHIAEDTAGFTGAELENILNESAIIATIKNHNAITNEDIDNALKKVIVGLEKNSRVISDKDKKVTAFHEAGHAVVSKFLPTQDDVREISIIPRGVAGGYTMYKNGEDKSYISKTEMEEKLISLLGGRAAEKIIFKDISTGASNDIEVATKIARDMVTIYGMNDKVGPVALNCGSQDNPNDRLYYGENISDIVGDEIKKLINNAYEKAQQILNENIDKLNKVAEILLEKEKITGDEFNKLFINNDEE